MRIVIVGPGALGSLLTARISLNFDKKKEKGADNDNHLYLLDYKPERVRFLSRNGLILEEGERWFACSPASSSDPAVCADAEVLFLCVKSTAVHAALERIRPFLSPAQLLIAMQNGIAHLQEFVTMPCCCGVGITSEGANLAATGHVRHGGAGLTRLGLMRANGQSCPGLLAATTDILNAAGLVSQVTDSPLKHIWAKLFANVGINALTAINGCRNGELLASDKIREKMVLAVREAEQVAGALGIPVVEDPVAVTLRICEQTGSNISSMLQDVRNLRQTEIGAINGAIVKEGERRGVPTPVNRELVRLVREIEAAYPG